MVLQEFVYQKEKSERLTKDLEKLNKTKRDNENYYDQEIKDPDRNKNIK